MTDQVNVLFTSLLKASGKKHAKHRSESDFSWMWSVPGAAPFLDWIAVNVDENCLLNTDQLSLYDRLQRSDHVLNETTTGVSSTSETYGPSTASIKCHISRVDSNIASSTQKQRALLGILSKGRLEHAKLVTSLQNAKHDLEAAHSRVSEEEYRSDRLMTELLSSSKTCYEKMHNAELSLVHLDLKAYLNMDKEFMSCIHKKLEKLQRGRDDDSAGGNMALEDKYSDNVDELERIKSVFAQSESNRIDADIRHRETIAEIRASFEPGFDPTVLEQASTLLEREAKSVYDGSLQPHLQRLAKYQRTSVLQGDYSLKIARQRDYIRIYEQVMNHILIQRSKHVLFGSAIKRVHFMQRQLLEFLTKADLHLISLEKTICELSERVPKTLPRQGRKSVDSHDRIGLSVDVALCTATSITGSPLLVTFDGMSSCANRLSSLIDADRGPHDAVCSQHITLLDRMKECTQQLYALLSASSLTHQPLLSYQPLTDSITHSQAMMDQLKERVTTFQIDEMNKRKVLVKEGSRLEFERNMFIMFFFEPSALDEDSLQISHLINSII